MKVNLKRKTKLLFMIALGITYTIVTGLKCMKIHNI